jgi:hypothetical protein
MCIVYKVLLSNLAGLLIEWFGVPVEILVLSVFYRFLEFLEVTHWIQKNRSRNMKSSNLDCHNPNWDLVVSFAFHPRNLSRPNDFFLGGTRFESELLLAELNKL